MGVALSTLRIGVKLGLKLVLGLPGWILGRPRPGLRVLFYHRVNPYPRARLGPVSREITVSPAAFEQQLRHLAARGWHSLTIADCAAVLAGQKPLPAKSMLITFDDGYEDNLLYAAPLLARFGFRATVFVIAGFLGRTSGAVWPHGDPPEFGRFLTGPQLHALQGAGLEIGSHTMTHPRLTEIGAEARERELADARASLEALLGHPVAALAYPEGDVDPAVEHAATSAGYALGFTTVPGRNAPGDRPTALRRTEVSASDSLLVFRMKLSGALDWLAFKESARFRAAIGAMNRRLMPFARPSGS